MNQPLRPEVEDAFASLLERPEAEQESFLAREYADRPELRAELESLLRAYRLAGSFLEPAGTSFAREFAAASPALPAILGRYRIIRLIGEGGMGTVYEAEQEQPRRTVALKVIKAGMTSPDLLWRFRQESQALGRLQHPGIAQIHEATTANSEFGAQPYFAMEFIQGASLVEYAETHRLGLRERLALIVKVCDAVHHAHQRGIIHRDLKPGNILVDETGQPKILDFGIARVAGLDVEVTRRTGLGQMVGTLGYMSPEQVLADPLEVDTRSDVYALGVILYELLAGRLPYKIDLQLHGALKTIRDEDPTPLSSLNRTYRGDVERIVAKALEKDKARRYSSAAEFGADIQRYLRDEPIVARPPSTAYQLRKFACRHKPLITGLTAVFVVLVAGIVVSAWEAARARQAEHVAATESATAKAVNDFLENDLLAQASASVQAGPDVKPDPELKVRTTLDRAATRLARQFGRQPLIEASLRQTIGKAYKDLGLYAEARQQLECALALQTRSLGDHHPDSLGTINALAEVYWEQGLYEKAEPLFTRTLQARLHVLGEKHPDSLRSMDELAGVYFDEGKHSQAETLYVRVLDLRRRLLGEEHADTLLSMNNLARLYLERGNHAQAAELCPKIFAARRRVLGDEHPDTLISEDNLARLYLNEGKYAQAEPLFLDILQARRRVLGETHPYTFLSVNNLAVVYRREGKFEEAASLLAGGVQERRRRMGESDPDTLLMMNNLARVYLDQGKYRQAEPLLTRALAIQRRVVGEQHPDTLIMMKNLARLYHETARQEQAAALLTTVTGLQSQRLGAEHPDTLSSLDILAHVYFDQGRYRQAESLFARVLETRRRILGTEHRDTTNVLAALGETRLRQRRYAEAEPLLRNAWQAQTRNSPESWETYNTESLLGEALEAQAKLAAAQPLLLAGYAGLIKHRAMIPAASRSASQKAGERILRLYIGWGKADKAAEYRQRLRTAIHNIAAAAR